MSCSSIEKAELNSSTPTEAIEEVEEQKRELYNDQTDLLSHKSFKKGSKKLNKARKKLSDNGDTKEIMELAAEAKAYFQRATNQANQKTEVPELILEARQVALDNGVMKIKNLRDELADIDENLRDATEKFTRELADKKHSKFQKHYLDLKVKAIQHKELHMARQVLDKAIANDADDKAPTTLSNTQKNINAAENLIAQNSSDSDAYMSSVENANDSAKLLDDVMRKIEEMGDDTSERVALRLVYQDRKIGLLSSSLYDLKGDLDRTQYSMSEMSGELQKKEQRLEAASSKLDLQENIEQIRRKFDENVAEVYQQGDKVIFRIKKMGFKVGSAELPSDSYDLLSNVRSAIKELNAKEITIQGHTDSTGSSQLNRKLSKQRADAVAKYMKSERDDDNEMIPISTEGYGESKPLSENNTKEGRALNRRVDVVVSTKE